MDIQDVVSKYFKSVLVNENEDFFEFVVESKGSMPIDASFEMLYDELVGRHNHAVLLFRDSNNNYVLRISKKAQKVQSRKRRIITVALFIATIASVAYAGYLTTQYFNIAVLSIGLSNLKLDVFVSTLFFTLAVMAPLLVHELSHYYVARKSMIPVTPPVLVPAPVISPLGTFGAIIGMKHLPKSLKDLVRVGLAGPLAGTILSYIIFTAMYALSPVVSYSAVSEAVSKGLIQELHILTIGTALIMKAAEVLGYGGNEASTVILNPPAVAALFIILIHFINLLPLGQLDGGHVFRGLTSIGAHKFAGFATLAIALVTALTVPNLLWLGIFVLLAFLITGLRVHPGAANLESKLQRRDRITYSIVYALLLLITAPIVI